MSVSGPVETYEQPMTTPWKALKPALPAVFICLAVNLAIFAGIAVRRPAYLNNYLENGNPDAKHYVLLGHNYLLRGEYSRCAAPPYVPDMVRTPVYPMFAGALDLLGGAGAIYLAQALLQAGSCLLLFVLVRACFGERAAFWASLLCATDLMLAIYNYEAMSEPLFVFLLLASLASIVPRMLRLKDAERGGLAIWLVVGGTLTGLAILTRPAALYLPVLFIGGLLAIGWRSRQAGRSFAACAILLLAILPLPALWIARNAMVFSMTRLTPVDAINYVYYAGAGAYELHLNVSFEEAQDVIEREYGLPSARVSQNPSISDLSQKEIDAELRKAVFSVLTKYPTELVQSSLLGVVKASFSHNAGLLANLLGGKWVAPGTSDLLRLHPEARGKLASNGSLLTTVFIWQFLHVLLSLLLAMVGIIVALRREHTRVAGLILLAVMGYFYLTIAMFGLEAYYRCRVPVLPFLYVFAGVGVAQLLSLGGKAARTQNSLMKSLMRSHG